MTGLTNGGRARAYEALRESEELHRATLSNISDAVFLTDDNGAFTFICPNVDVIFGYVPDEVQLMPTIGGLLGPGLCDPIELAAKGEICNIEREITAKSGQRRTVLIHMKRVSIKGGTVLYVCRDVSELRRAENELATARVNLAHAARLALVGQLTASIVHEIQQPVGFLHLNLTRVQRILNNHERAAELGELRRIFDAILNGSTAAIEIIDRLRTLMRKRPLELHPLDLNALIKDVLPLVNPDASLRGVTICADLAPSLPMIDGDRVSLQHMMLDLIINAMDAMSETSGERRIVVRTHPGTASVELTVSDTGGGISAENKTKIFDAFFTTKTDGVGLGLAMADSIAEAHGAQMAAEDREGGGTTFRLVLPLRATIDAMRP